MIRSTPELSWLTGATTGVTMVTTETKLARANTFYPIDGFHSDVINSKKSK